jgi:hypothetical protein
VGVTDRGDRRRHLPAHPRRGAVRRAVRRAGRRCCPGADISGSQSSTPHGRNCRTRSAGCLHRHHGSRRRRRRARLRLADRHRYRRRHPAAQHRRGCAARAAPRRHPVDRVVGAGRRRRVRAGRDRARTRRRRPRRVRRAVSAGGPGDRIDAGGRDAGFSRGQVARRGTRRRKCFSPLVSERRNADRAGAGRRDRRPADPASRGGSAGTDGVDGRAGSHRVCRSVWPCPWCWSRSATW